MTHSSNQIHFVSGSCNKASNEKYEQKKHTVSLSWFIFCRFERIQFFTIILIIIFMTYTIGMVYIMSFIALGITQTLQKHSVSFKQLRNDLPQLFLFSHSHLQHDDIKKEWKTNKILMKQWWNSYLKAKLSCLLKCLLSFTMQLSHKSDGFAQDILNFRSFIYFDPQLSSASESTKREHSGSRRLYINIFLGREEGKKAFISANKFYFILL